MVDTSGGLLSGGTLGPSRAVLVSIGVKGGIIGKAVFVLSMLDEEVCVVSY